MQKIGNQVEKIRKSRKINQSDAGKAIGITQGAYSQKASGHVDFTAEDLFNLALLFGVPVAAFYENGLPEIREPEENYGNKDLSREAVNGRFIMVARRYMADHKIKTVVDLAEKMKVETIHLTQVMNGNKHLSMTIMSKAVAHTRFNANYIMSHAGDYYLRPEDMKGQIAELSANYERSLEDKNKLIRSYEALLKEKGVKI